MFYLCRKCDRVFISKSEKLSKCDQCNEALEEKKNKFILQCKLCLEYYPRRIIALSIQEGKCICLNPQCKGDLMIRYQISELSIASIKSEKELEDIIKEQVSLNLNLPKKPQIDVKKKIPQNNNDLEENIDSDRQLALVNQVQQNFKKLEKTISLETPPSSDPKAKISEILTPVAPNDEKKIENHIKKKDFKDLVCDPLTLDPKLTSEQLIELLEKSIAKTNPELDLSLIDYMNIMVNLLIDQHLNNSVIKEEEIPACAYYVGSLSGDFVVTQKIIQHFQIIVKKKPEIKFIFLGNMIGANFHNLETLILLYLFLLNYPENVIILRGSNELFEKASEIGLWNQIEQKFSSLKDNKDNIQLLCRYILYSFAHLPLFHLGTMPGPIAVLATHSGIPHFENISNQVFRIDHDLEAFFWGAENYDSLDSFSLQILCGIPQDALSEQPILSSKESVFKKETFFQFIKENRINYLVRSHNELKNGVEYSYGGYICSIFSTSKYTQPPSREFMAKIVRLTPGQSPKEIVPTQEGLESDLHEILQ